MLTLSIIFAIVGAILICLFLNYTADKSKSFNINSVFDLLAGVITPVIGAGLIILSIVFAYNHSKNTSREWYDSVKDYVYNQGYSVYIDGVEVDVSHITIENYNRISINEEIREVHISTQI